MNNSVKTILALLVSYITFVGAFVFSVSADAATSTELVAAAIAPASVSPMVVRAPGTFVPSACGEVVQPENKPVVSKVCMGKIAGELSKSAMGAFEFRDEAGNPAVYRVTEVSNLLVKLISGATRAQVFMVGPNGDQISMKINRMADGTVTNAAGQIGDAKFMVPAFESIMTTM